MLQAENLSLGYGKSPAIVSDVGFRVAAGELVVLIGPNGSGKSTLLRAIAAILKPRRGRLLLDGIPIQCYAPRQMARRTAFLAQSPDVPEDFTVKELISYGRSPHLTWTGRMRAKDWRIVQWAMAQTRLEPLAQRMVVSLSGGERQRARLAMALAQQPKLLLLDEPTTFLDICYQFEVLELVRHLNRALGITTIMVLHDLNQAARYADRILALHNGTIAAAGAPEQVVAPEQLARIFNMHVAVRIDPHHHCPLIIPLRSLNHPPSPVLNEEEHHACSTRVLKIHNSAAAAPNR
jgi:iron complex transport system ATP-binding protein